MKAKLKFLIVILSLAAAAAVIFSCLYSEWPPATSASKDFITYAEFNVPYSALAKAMETDINTHKGPIHCRWVELLAYLAAKYYGDFSLYKGRDMDAVTEKLLAGESMEKLTEGLANYEYYFEVYDAVLGGMLGEYSAEVPVDGGTTEWCQGYGLTAFSPIAKNFGYEHYDDFGAQRTYGYARRHLGHDMIAETGTPVVAVESGIVECLGWNQYGGWRIGIRSMDGKRYYYYAHLRQNRPYAEGLMEGDQVIAGEVVGYVGHTGYSTKENVNNIRVSHLHLGIELIFDESQKECDNEIWIDLYSITQLLARNCSEVYRVAETKEFYRKYGFYVESKAQ